MTKVSAEKTILSSFKMIITKGEDREKKLNFKEFVENYDDENEVNEKKTKRSRWRRGEGYEKGFNNGKRVREFSNIS